MTKMIAAMTISERARLTEGVRAHVPIRRDGRIEYRARANAIQGTGASDFELETT